MLLTIAYESAKSAWLPGLSPFQSHALTTVYCSLVALVFAVILLRIQQRAVVMDAVNPTEAVIEQLPGLACIIGPRQRYIRWNARVEQKLGYSPAEMRQLPVLEAISERYRDSMAAVMQQAFQSGYGDAEAEWVTKTGETIPCYLMGVRVSIGDEPCLLGIGVDLSAQKRAQDALRSSEAQYRRLLSNLPDVTWTIDAEGRIHYVSRNVEEVFGYTPQEVLGGEMALRASRIHPDDQLVAVRSFELLFGENRIFDVEYRIRHKDGRWIWVRSRALRTYGMKDQLLADGVLVDITRQKQAEAVDAKLAAIVRSSIDAVIGLTADGVIQTWNPAAQTMFGHSAEEAVGQSVAILIPPDHLHELPVVLEKTKSGEQIGRFDSVGVRKDGRRLHLSLANSPIVDKNGAILGLSLVAHDISQRKQSEEALHHSATELRKAKEVAEEANWQKTRFLGNMSKALNTPMNAILGMTEMALGTVLTAEQREYLLTIKTEGDALLGLTNDLLDFTRSEFGNLQLEPVRFRLRELVRDSVQSLFADAEQMGVATSLGLASELPEEVVGDFRRLRQVLSNLVRNAVKYTFEGSINLQAECRRCSENQVELQFRLSDTGVGIPADKHQRIFEPFTNRDGATPRRQGGSGLGLAISARLVELMDGKIWLESEPGRGSTFYFTTKLQLPPVSTPAAAN
jgi:two-component system, sensor histidine kinase and response regulator